MQQTLYGWYYSVPALAFLTALLMMVAAALAVIARPPLAADIAADTATRYRLVRHVLMLATAAMLLHLSGILASLSGTASMEGRASTADGWVLAYGRFSALEGSLLGAAQLTGVVGWTGWFLVLLTALTTASSSTAQPQSATAEPVH